MLGLSKEKAEKNIVPPLILINIAIISAIYFILADIPQKKFLEYASKLNVKSLELSWFLLATGILLSWKNLKESYFSINRNTRITLLALLIISALVVSHLTPRTNRIYFDEHIYQNIGQGILHTGEAAMCNECNAEAGTYKVFKREFNKQPHGFPFYLSLTYRALGISEVSAHAASNYAYLIGIFALFAFVLFQFKSEKAALLSALFYALTPMTIIWSNTSAAEPSAAGFAALAMFTAIWFCKYPNLASSLTLGASVGIAAQFRPESLILILPAYLLILINSPRAYLKPQIYWAALITILSVTPLLLHLYSFRDHSWGSSGEKFAAEVFWKNIKVNGPYYFKNIRFPLLFGLLAILGIFFGKQYKKKIPIYIWLLYSWGIFLFFYAGSYNYGADVRFALVSAAPIAILAGLGATWLTETKLPLIKRSLATSILLIAIFFCWSKFLPLIRAYGQEARMARADIEVGRIAGELLPPESIIASHTPTFWLMRGRNALQTSTAMFNTRHFDYNIFRRYPGGVFFHHGSWCNVDDPRQTRFCKFIEDKYILEPVVKNKLYGKVYAVYRLHKKS